MRIFLRLLITCLTLIGFARVADAQSCPPFCGPPSLVFNIPSVPGTGGGYFAGATGAGGQQPIYGEQTPVFTVGVTGFLSVDPVFESDQYGDVAWFNPTYDIGSGQNSYQVILESIFSGCNVLGPDGCNLSQLPVPDSVNLQLILPPYSQISFVNGEISLSAIPPVPEPSTWAMLLMGFAALGFAGYVRSKRPRSCPDRTWPWPVRH